MKKAFFLYIILGLGLLSQPLPKVGDVRFYGPLNTQNVEYNPIISPTGRYLVFQSNRPGGEGGMDIWVSENASYPDRMKLPLWDSPKDRNSKATFARCAVQCTLRDRAVKRPARMPRVPLLRLGGARGALCPRVRPACGCLPGALAVSRASGDVDAMLKSLGVGRIRTYQTRSWFWFS